MRTGEAGLLLGAAFVVVILRMGLWLLPARLVIRATLWLQRPKPVIRRLVSGGRHPEQVAWAVRVVSRVVPGASCLTQALAAQALLARSSEPPRLRIGVAQNGDGVFRAHAWLEARGRVIIGGGELGRYARLPDLKRDV
jgi:hypothetical protein